MDCLVVKKRNRLSESSSDNAKTNSKLSPLICLVCGAPATGFNFSVITCMCCKAFFRRNALFGLESYQCRYLSENCTINMRTRRDCSFCRLNKCFQVGMKKELILTDDAKRLKRERLAANRQMTLVLVNRTYPFNDDNYIYLENLSNFYEDYCRSPIMTFEKRENELYFHQPLKTRVKLQRYLEFYQIHASSLVAFLKCIPEYQELTGNDQINLTKHHLHFLLRINSVATIDDSVPLWGAINLVLETIYGRTIIKQVTRCLNNFNREIKDSKCILLFIIILLFSTFGDYKGNINSVSLYKIQEKYIQILWLYLIKYYGEKMAFQKFSLMIRYCLYLQTISHVLELKKEEAQWHKFFLSIQ